MCSVTGTPVLVLRGTMWYWVGYWDNTMARGGRDRQTEDDISAENSQLSGELELEANQPSVQYVCRNNGTTLGEKACSTSLQSICYPHEQNLYEHP